MDKESKKRSREGEDTKEFSETSHTAKKQHLNTNNNKKQSMGFGESNREEEQSLSENNLALGVFDFPWLKEGMISKSDDWKLEDTFSSSLLNTNNGVELYGQRLCETPEEILVDFPDDLRVVEDDYGLEGLDCFWSSLLNQPLSPPAFH